MGRRRGAVNVLLLFLMMGLTAVAGALLAMTVAVTYGGLLL